MSTPVAITDPRHKAQLQVEAINLDGICDEIAALAARLPIEYRPMLVLALADIERARDALIAEAER